MRYIRDKICLQAFTFHALCERRFQTFADGIHLFCNFFMLCQQSIYRDLIIHFPAGDLLDPGLDLSGSFRFLYHPDKCCNIYDQQNDCP